MDIEEALAIMGAPARLSGGTPRAAYLVDHEAQILAAAVQPPLAVKLPVPAVGLTGPLVLRPIDALMRLAKVTSPRIPDDVHDAYRHWAWLRYLGTLDHHPGPRLKLSASGARVRANQRRVMSEELGVGFGVLLAEHWCRILGGGATVTPVDVDVVLNEGYGWVTPKRVTSSGRQPDYLLLVDHPSRPSAKMVKTLECKGAVSPTNVKGQLARALTQLASLQVDGATPQGVAVAIVSGPKAFEYAALDPEEDEFRTYEVTAERIEAVRQPKALRRARRLELAGDELVPTAAAVGIGALADFAGNTQAAARWLPPTTSERLSRSVKDRVVRESEDGPFLGFESQFPTPDGRRRLSVFQGLAVGVDGAVSDGWVEGVAEQQAEFAGARRALGRDELGTQSAGDDDRTVSATSNDGAMLRIAIEG